MVLGSIPNGGNFKVPRRFSTTSASIAQLVERSPLKLLIFLSAAACACAFGFFLYYSRAFCSTKAFALFFSSDDNDSKKKKTSIEVFVGCCCWLYLRGTWYILLRIILINFATTTTIVQLFFSRPLCVMCFCLCFFEALKASEWIDLQ